jgi:hypothetical protein
LSEFTTSANSWSWSWVTCLKQVTSNVLIIAGTDQSVYFYDVSSPSSPTSIYTSSNKLTNTCSSICLRDSKRFLIAYQQDSFYSWSDTNGSDYNSITPQSNNNSYNYDWNNWNWNWNWNSNIISLENMSMCFLMNKYIVLRLSFSLLIKIILL